MRESARVDTREALDGRKNPAASVVSGSVFRLRLAQTSLRAMTLLLALSSACSRPALSDGATPAQSSIVNTESVATGSRGAAADTPDGGSWKAAAEHAQRVARFRAGVARFEAEKRDAIWAPEMERTIDSTLAGRFSSVPDTSVESTACRRNTCVVQIHNPHGMRQVTPIVMAALRQLRDEGYPISLSLSTDPNSAPMSQGATIGRYYMPFVR